MNVIPQIFVERTRPKDRPLFDDRRILLFWFPAERISIIIEQSKVWDAREPGNNFARGTFLCSEGTNKGLRMWSL